MKPEDIKIGMGVCVRYDRFRRGKITSLPDQDGCVQVKWNDYPGQPISEYIDDLSSYDPDVEKEIAKTAQVNFDKAKSALEQAFDLLKETYGTDEGINLNYLEREGLINFQELLCAFEKFAWSSSSLHC